MKQYYVNKEIPITTDVVAMIINDFMLVDLPVLKKRFDYFMGKQQILRKQASDSGKPCNKVVTNFVRNIVDTYEGYSVGVPVSYSSDNQGYDILQEIFNYNDIDDEDSQLFRDALIYGRASEICYLDIEKKQRFRTLNPQTIIPVYSDDLNKELIYVIRFWEQCLNAGQDQEYFVEVYDNLEVTTYKSQAGFSSFQFIDRKPHYHNQVPITIFSLNEEEEGLAEQIFPLQDAYNSLLSDSIDDFDSFCDAYMVIKGMTADDEDIKSMKEHRVLLMDSDASAEYLTKDVSTQEVQNLLSTCESKIREVSACPNFSNEAFNTSSGIAIRFRMMAMENKVSSIMNNFKKAIQKRIELLAEIIKVVNGEDLWRDIEITFHRNIPTDLATIGQEINAFRGLVSDETLLGQIPFITDVQEELRKIQEENNQKQSLFTNERLTIDEQVEE